MLALSPPPLLSLDYTNQFIDSLSCCWVIKANDTLIVQNICKQVPDGGWVFLTMFDIQHRCFISYDFPPAGLLWLLRCNTIRVWKLRCKIAISTFEAIFQSFIDLNTEPSISQEKRECISVSGLNSQLQRSKSKWKMWSDLWMLPIFSWPHFTHPI